MLPEDHTSDFGEKSGFSSLGAQVTAVFFPVQSRGNSATQNTEAAVCSGSAWQAVVVDLKDPGVMGGHW